MTAKTQSSSYCSRETVRKVQRLGATTTCTGYRSDTSACARARATRVLGSGNHAQENFWAPWRWWDLPQDSANCYWQRTTDDSGDMDSIIANDNLNPDARASITVNSGEFFKSSGCGTCTKV